MRVIHREYDALLTWLSFEFKSGFKFSAEFGLPVADYWSLGNPSADLIVPCPSCVDRTRRRVCGCRFSDVRPPVSISDEAEGPLSGCHLLTQDACDTRQVLREVPQRVLPAASQTVLADLGFKM